MLTYDVEYTDTFGGEANYCWAKRATVTVPDLTHYGYDGQAGYTRADRSQRRELMRRAKAAVGLTGVRGLTYDHGHMIEFRPHKMCTVLFVTFKE